MLIVQQMFSRRWIFTTLLVFAGTAVLVRLGIWQLQRLEQRKAFNARVLAQTSQPALALEGSALAEDLSNMEYRQASAVGRYDFEHQIALRGQYYENQWGVHLVTPLILDGGQAILVDRGWIPATDFESGDWSKYDEPGSVTVQGVLRQSRSRADFGSRSDPTPLPGGAPLKAWNFVNIPAIQIQTPYRLLPAYLQQAPDPHWSGPPYRSQPELELSEGPHMGYALQWFTFAAILFFGYPVFLRRQTGGTI